MASNSYRADAVPTRGRLSVSWDRRDGHIAVTLVALGLTAIAVGMAIFGLPPFSLGSPIHELGITCPFCGGTRSARLTTQGHLVEAWRYNPLGILVVAVSAVVVVRAAFGAITRRWLNVAVELTPRTRRVLLVAGLVLLMLLVIRQQMRADLLRGG